MLDKIINEHVDKQDAIEEKAAKDIDQIIDSIKIDALIADPQAVLGQIVEAVSNQVKEAYWPEAVQNGIEIGKTINGLKRDIKIQKTSDPHLNKDSQDGSDRQD